MVTAHDVLARLYEQLGYLDLSLHHLREQMKYSSGDGGKSAGPEGQTGPQEILAQREKTLAGNVRDQLAKLETKSSDLDVAAQASLARQLGLPGKALDILLAADSASLGGTGALLGLDLFLWTGQPGKVRDWLNNQSKPEEILGLDNYHSMRIRVAAVEGDYNRLDEELQSAITALTGANIAELNMRNVPFRTAIGMTIGRYMLSHTSGIYWKLRDDDEPSFKGRAAVLGLWLRQQQDFQALRGMFAVEAGEIERAVEAFRENLALAGTVDEPSNALARHYLELIGNAKAGR
jgi:hypothetical protein